MPNTYAHGPGQVPHSLAVIRAHAGHYRESRLWDKFVHYAQRAGRELLEKALWLYYAAQKPETPAWARTTAFGALGYLIVPMDAIPDWLPGIGLTDDLGALTLAVATLCRYIDEDVRQQTAQQLERWFGAAGRHADSRTR